MSEPFRPVAYLGDHVALTLTKYNHYMYVDTRDVSIAPHILMRGDWEPWVTRLWRETVGTDMVVVDVGSNVGWFSVLACAAGARSYAFEPNRRLADLSMKTMAVNGFAGKSSVAPLALGAERGTVGLCLHHENQGGTHVSPDWTLQVGQVRLDDYLCKLDSVDVIKIDVEGYEHEVIKGAQRLIRGSPRVRLFIEHHRANVALLDWLLEEGFRLHHNDHGGAARPVSRDEAAALADAEVLYCMR